MKENFDLLYLRVSDVLKNLDKKNFSKTINSIDGNTICTGSGGSIVVAEFASEVIESKNNSLTKVVFPRDLLHIKINFYKNILIISSSGKNHGVFTAINTNLNKFLLTSGQLHYGDVKMLHYRGKMDLEKKFYFSFNNLNTNKYIT